MTTGTVRRSNVLWVHVLTVVVSVVATYGCMFVFGISVPRIDTRRLMLFDQTDNTVAVVDSSGIRLFQPIRIVQNSADPMVFVLTQGPDGSLRVQRLGRLGQPLVSVELATKAEAIRVLNEQDQEIWRSQ